MKNNIRAIVIRQINPGDQFIGKYIIEGEVSIEIIKGDLIIKMGAATKCYEVKKLKGK